MVTEIKKGPQIADDLGEEIFNEGKVRCRRINYQNDSDFPINVLLSPAIIESYRRTTMGLEKADLFQRAATDWIASQKEKIQNYISQGKKFLWIPIWFGGRAFNLRKIFREIIDPDYQLPAIGIKFQRDYNPTPTGDHGWSLACWGATSLDYDYDQPWIPMPRKQKKEFDFEDLKDVFVDLKKRYGDIDCIASAEGAVASGLTTKGEANLIGRFFPKIGLSIPEEIFLYANFGSGFGTKLFIEACHNNGIIANVTLGGSITEVSAHGKMPGLPYTEVSPLGDNSVTFQSLVNSIIPYYTNTAGQVVPRCSCGDVGESLDEEEHYIIDTMIECMIWGVNLKNEGWDRYLGNGAFVEKLKMRIAQIENEHHCRLIDPDGVPISEILNGVERPPSMPTRFLLY